MKYLEKYLDTRIAYDLHPDPGIIPLYDVGERGLVDVKVLDLETGRLVDPEFYDNNAMVPVFPESIEHWHTIMDVVATSAGKECIVVRTGKPGVEIVWDDDANWVTPRDHIGLMVWKEKEDDGSDHC